MMKRLILGAGWAILLAGCANLFTHTVYHQPASPEGRVCTSQCYNAQQQCRSRLEAQSSECQTQHRYAMDSYKRCKEAGGKDCREPPMCSYPGYYRCDGDYKACFGACGGTMEERPGL